LFLTEGVTKFSQALSMDKSSYNPCLTFKYVLSIFSFIKKFIIS